MDVLEWLLWDGLRRLGIDSLLPDPAFAVTVGTLSSLPVFDDIPFGQECVRLLRHVCDRTGARLYAYCLMPDHACLLVGPGGGAALRPTVTAWKTLCSRARRQRGSWVPFWQQGYAERAVAGPEALRTAARYVLEKPVRAGLVSDFRDYPLCGTLDRGP
ncbi:MAG TPA: transposase [Thermoanaerobaculia bacterium]|nr:transposase [Thermoanaerobaculia bacterium]